MIEELHDHELRASAQQRLVAMGPDAIPTLIMAVADKDWHVREAAAEVLDKIDPQWHKTAEATAAIPALLTAVADEDSGCVRKAAAWALGRIGPEAKAAIPALIMAVADENADVRRAAAAALGRIGPEAKAAIPVLIAAVADEDSGVRKAAAQALGQIEPAATVPKFRIAQCNVFMFNDEI